MVGRQAIDEAVAEFEASCADRLNMFVYRSKVIGGAAEYCGSHADPTRWTLAYVRDDRAVLPLAVGERDQVVHEYARLSRAGTPIWDPEKFSPPRVIVDGTAYHFAPGYGRVLIGQVRLERRAVLLAAIDDALAVIHVAGRVRTVLHVGKPHSFRELDVDRLLRLQGRCRPRSRHAEQSGPVRPPPPIEAEHRRIVHGLAVEVGTGPTIARVLVSCFEDVADRARALKAIVVTRIEEKLKATADRARGLKASATRRVRGKVWARPVVRYLCKLAIRGHGNIVGRVSEILAIFGEHFPDFTITAEALSDVLGLLHALGTCLVGPRADGDRIWEINLAGLTDPRSSLHRRLCRETKGRPLIDAAAMDVGGGTETSAGATPTPTTSGPLTAAVDAVQTPREVSLDHDADIKEILAELCRLPPGAGSDLLAATLKQEPVADAEADIESAATVVRSAPERGQGGAPPFDAPVVTQSTSAPAQGQVDAPISAAPNAAQSTSTPARDQVDAPIFEAPVVAPTTSAPEQSQVGALHLDPETTASSSERGHVAENTWTRDAPTSVATPGVGGEAILDELRQLPAAAAHMLLLGSQLHRRRLETAAPRADADDSTTTPEAPAPPEIRPRRRLHLSPDHTLVLPRVAVVAEVARPPVAGEGQAQSVVLGPARPVGDGPSGARGPPKT